MACGLEVRAPFLDADAGRRSAAAAGGVQVRPQADQAVAQAAVSGRLPPSILSRPKKGFGIPVARWLRGELAPLLDRLLDPERLTRQGLFRPEEVARRIDEHRAGVRDHRKPLWTLLMFQLWYDAWLS